jgi:hypothetical protein
MCAYASVSLYRSKRRIFAVTGMRSFSLAANVPMMRFTSGNSSISHAP